MIVPEIEASQAYKNTGAIILWWDESEGGDTSAYTIPEIIISSDAKSDAYTNNILYTHSSDLLTMQEIFNIGPCLLDACSTTDLSDLFTPGSIPNRITTDVVPEPRSILLVTAGLFGLALMRRHVLSG